MARRAHASRLLATLLCICRELRLAQKDPVAERAYRDIEDWLAAGLEKRRKE